jgi:ABC-type sugar transport system ATPase subunit
MVVRGCEGPTLAPALDMPAEAGIRPEALRLAATGLPARVTHAEYLGADTILACEAGDGVRLLARLPGRTTLAPGALVHLAADPADIHLFDAATGRRLAATPALQTA